MNTRSKERIQIVEKSPRRKGRGDNIKDTDKLPQSGVHFVSSPSKINKKNLTKSPIPKSEHLQHTSKQIDQSINHNKNSNESNVALDKKSNCVIEDKLNASLETKFVRPLSKGICNVDSPSKHQRFYLRSSVVEKIDKRTTYQSISPTNEELYSSDVVGINEIFNKQTLDAQSSENNITEFHSTEYSSDVECYEMQHSDLMQRTDSPSSFSSDSASFSSRIPKFRDDFGLNIIHHQSPYNRNGNIITSPTRGRLQRHSSGSSFSSEMSNISLKNQSKSSPSVCEKWLWHKNKQLSEVSCVQNDNQLKQLEKQPCMSVFFTGTEYVPVPSEAETAPHNPRGEMLFGDIVSKMQQNFAEEKNNVSCHWLTPDEFHVKTVSLLEQKIEENINCKDDPCKNSNFTLKKNAKTNGLLPSSDGINHIDNENSSSSPDKKRKKRSQTALLHAALQEIFWAKNLNPENMMTSERRPKERDLRDSTKKKTQDGAQALKRKELTKKLRKNKRIFNNSSKNTGKLNKTLPTSKAVGRGVTFLDVAKVDKRYNKQSSILSPQKASKNVKSKQIVKKYIKKNEKSPKMKTGIVGRPKKNLKNEKILLHEEKKPSSSNLTKVTKNKVCLTSKSNMPAVKQMPSNSKFAKHKSDSSAGKLLSSENSYAAEPKHKSAKSSDSSIDQVPELRVTLKPLDDINIWKIRKKNEEIKRKHCHYSSKSYKLTTTKGELKARVFHKMKTTWNKITPEQNQRFCSSGVGSNVYSSFGGMKRSSTFSTYRTSKRKRYDEETTRYSIRQSECAFRYKEIAVKKHHNFIQIILVPNRSRQNSLTVEGMKELREALFAACKDPGCRAVLFNSSGSIFCSGIDLNPVIGCTRKVVVEEIANSIRDLVQTMGSFPKPLVAAVNGMAVGFGVTLLTFCDIVLASDKATFFMPYAKLGYIAEGAATLTLPQVVGATMATDMLLRGRKLTAQEALRCGLVSEVLWPTHLMEEAVPRMQALAAQSLQVMEATKSMIRYHLWEKLQSTLEDECRSLPKQWISSICQQAIRNAMENNILME